MPPSKKLPQVIRNHVLNHRIPRTTTTAVFVIYPAGVNTRLCSIGWGIRAGVDIHRRHYPKQSKNPSNVFVTSWALEGRFVTQALENLHLHATKAVWKRLDVIVLIYAHANNKVM